MTDPIRPAVENLRQHQRQLDMDGIFVGVSRQALEEVLDYIEADRAAIREAMEPVNRKKFPILGAPGATIDWQLVHDHGRQAKANHYQTVERLAERGGLSWCELHAILHNRPWQKMEENTAIMECRALEARYLSSILPEIKP